VRHLRLLVLLTSALALGGCGQTVHFDTEASGTATVQGGGLGAALGAFPAISSFSNIDFNSTQDFRNNGVTEDDVKSVRLKRALLRIVSPSDANFDWLGSLRFSVEANGEQKKVIAFKDGIDKLGLAAPFPQLEFELGDVELQPYIVAPAMSITTEGTGRTPPRDVTIEAVFTFGVDAYLAK
jgi:hypothetical protein